MLAPMNRRAGTLLQGKEQHGRRSDFYLLVVAGRLQCFTSRQESGGEFSGALDGCAINRLGDAVEFFVGGVEQNHAPLRKDAGKEPGEGRAQSLAGTVSVAQKLRGLGIVEQL